MVYMPELSEADESLRALLLDEQVLEVRRLNQVLAAREQGWQRAIRRFVGVFAQLEPGRLRLSDYTQERELAVWQLACEEDPDEQPVTLFLLGADGELERAALLAQETGLLLTNEGCWVQTRDPLDLPLLGLSQRLQLLPGHDLAISPRRDVLAVSERAAGRVLLFSLARHQQLAAFPVREPGSHKAINLAFTATGPQRGRLWFTDNASDRIGWLDPGQAEPEWRATGLGRLGQLLAEEDAVYVLALTPMLRLIRFAPASLAVVAELDLPGTPASLAPGVPTDVLERDPASGELLVLTQEYGQQAPTLLRLDPSPALRVEPLAMPPVAGWAMLLPGQVNPVQKWATRRLDDWIAELDLLSAEHLARLRQESQFGSLIGPRVSSYEVPSGAEDPIETLLRPAPPIKLPAETEAVLAEWLAQGVYTETGLNLRAQSAEMARLREAATGLKAELETHYVAIAALDQLAGRHDFELVITREALLRSLDYHAGGKTLPFRPGHLCPICALRVKNPRMCPHCGFALDDPDWLARRRNQSAEACDELIPGQLVFALPHARRIVFLDAWLQVIGELAGIEGGSPDSPLQRPAHVLALPEGNWLVCDGESGQVYEITPQGELIGALDHRFVQPVLSTFRLRDGQLADLLVLDAGAREVLVFSRDGSALESWGPADGLRIQAPTDLQWTWQGSLLICEPDTPRVLEWRPDTQQPVAVWGRAEQLKQPVLARRQLNGETLIADAGRGELLIYGEDGQLSRSFRYWPPEGYEQLVGQQPAPDAMLVLPGGDLVGFGRKYWMQLQMTLGRIRWVQPWTGARRPPQQKKQLQARMSETDALRKLRKIHLLRPLETASLAAVAEGLEPAATHPGDWVLRPGDTNGILFFLLEGEVEMLRPEDKQPLAVLTAGDTFGEVPLMLSEPFEAGFRARGDVKLMQLKRSHYKKAVGQAGDLVPALRELAHQRRHLLASAAGAAQQDMMEKVKAQLAIKRLQELFLFADASPELLAELAECMRPLAFMPAKPIFEQEALAETLYFISRGKVGLYLEGMHQPFLEIGAGDVVGELALLNQQVHPCGGRSESYCQLYALDMAGLSRVMLLAPELKPALETIALERVPALETAREQLAYQEPEAEGLGQAEVLQLTRVRPALAYIASDYHEKTFCLDEAGQLLWQTEGSQGRLYRPTRLCVGDDLLWVADTGNDRVVALSRADGRYVRSYGSRLNLAQPRSVFQTLHQHLLIADEGNQRLILVSGAGELLWEYGQPELIARPWFAEQTLKGTVLFCDRDLHMVFEIDPRTKQTIWSYGHPLQAGDGPEELHEPSCVRRLSNGATLIVDTGNHRLLLLSPVGTLMRSFEGNRDIPMIRPLHVELMASGEMWVYTESGDTVIRLGLSGQPVWRAELPR